MVNGRQLKSIYREPLYRNSIVLIISSSSYAILGMLFWVVASHSMDTKSMGLATSALSAATMIGSLSLLGMDASIVRYLPGSKNQKELYSIALTIAVLLSIVITSIFLAGLGLFSPAHLFLREGWLLPIFFSYVVISSAILIQNIAMISLRRSDLSFIQNLFQSLKIPIILLAGYLGVYGFFISYGIASLVSLAVGAFFLYRCGLSLKFGINKTLIKEIVGFSLGNYVSMIVMIAPITIMPMIIVNTVGAEDGAYFYVAYTLASLILLASDAVLMSLFVEGSHDMPLRTNVINGLKFVTLIMAPAIIVFILFGDKILLLFGHAYSANSFGILRLLALSNLLSIIPSLYILIKNIQKDVKIRILVISIRSASIIILGIFFLLSYGIIGLGYAWLLSNILVCMVVALLILRREKWSLFKKQPIVHSDVHIN